MKKRFLGKRGLQLFRLGINPDGTRYGVDSRPKHIRQVAARAEALDRADSRNRICARSTMLHRKG